jgi:predicted alpha-1,2-mannosidase
VSQRRSGGLPVSVLILSAFVLGLVTVAPAAGATADQAGAMLTTASAPKPVTDPSGLVRPLDGTGAGPVSPGAVGEFPGADVPFGMIQWSPDTTPDSSGSGGGYSYADDHINGFSLTHLSGTGCASYGDVPILPTVGPIGSAPVTTVDSFSHSTEQASPGRYRVVVDSGPAHTQPPGQGQPNHPITTTGADAEPSGAISTDLAVTTRTGLSRLTFPSTDRANILFKVADSANPVIASSVAVSDHDEITGKVTSGQFCGTGTNYTLYFAARFNRPFTASGSWSGAVVSPGRSTCSGTACGAYATFDTTSDPVVLMKVGISFVSVRNAVDNLTTEDPGWAIGHVEALATSRWNALLDGVRIGGGTPGRQRTFYTALYHSLLFPNVVSDVNGEYDNPDGRLHRVASEPHYANFSEWDIYRSEIELVSLLAPHQAGAMIESLVDDGRQGGWLPKWAIVDGDASQMNGDSADPIIAAAYAFGVRGFNVPLALQEMVRGANRNESGHGFEIERQYLDQYLSQHYVDAGSLDLTSIDYSMGGSVTLEYALDDFSIAQLAEARDNGSLYRSMMARAHNWEYLFDPGTGSIQGRGEDGSFPAGPAFQTSLLEPGGELGFEEGNAVQYTWSVPQDLSALASLMGGDADAVKALDQFFAQLNAGRDAPFDWSGNEPNLWTPWEYDSFGAPWRTQAVVRSIADSQYADAPTDEPGNDDLGALSSWYVWAAMGLYPVTPGSGDLSLASPLFPLVTIRLGDGHRIVMRAASASASVPYVHGLEVTGVSRPRTAACATTKSVRPASSAWCQPWLPASVLTTGGTLTYELSAHPDPAWGSSSSAAPPSYGAGRLPAVGFSDPGGRITLEAGRPATVELGVRSAQPGGSTVVWRAGGAGLTVTPDSGRFTLRPAPPLTQALVLTSSAPGAHLLEVNLSTTTGTPLPPVVLEVSVEG